MSSRRQSNSDKRLHLNWSNYIRHYITTTHRIKTTKIYSSSSIGLRLCHFYVISNMPSWPILSYITQINFASFLNTITTRKLVKKVLNLWLLYIAWIWTCLYSVWFCCCIDIIALGGFSCNLCRCILITCVIGIGAMALLVQWLWNTHINQKWPVPNSNETLLSETFMSGITINVF